MGRLLEIRARGTTGVYSKRDTRKTKSAISSKMERIPIFRKHLGTNQEFEELLIEISIVPPGLLTSIASSSMPIFAYTNGNNKRPIFDAG